jgi:26S proteasome regulatory subunit N1
MPMEKKEDDTVAITVSSKPNEKKDDNKKKTDKDNAEELSEEDKNLKEGLDLAVTRLGEKEEGLHRQAIDHLINEIRSSTSSMTSVPKPLKFLRQHYSTIKEIYERWSLDYPLKKSLSDVLSVLAMTMAPPGSRESLKFKLQGTLVDISSWGHEYVRSLAG